MTLREEQDTELKGNENWIPMSPCIRHRKAMKQNLKTDNWQRKRDLNLEFYIQPNYHSNLKANNDILKYTWNLNIYYPKRLKDFERSNLARGKLKLD